MLDSISHSPWSLIGLCLAMTALFSSQILYGLIKKKVYFGVAPAGGHWASRAEDPFFYWFYLGIYSFFDGVAIYGLITLSYQFSNGLPVKL